MNPNLVNIASRIVREAENPAATNAGKKDKQSRLEKAIEDNGLTVEDVAREVRNMMTFAEKDTDRIKAIQLAADLNGLRKDNSGPAAPIINIVVQGDADLDMILVPPSS